MKDSRFNRIIIHAKRAEGIARRYFITNGFDGALTLLGLMVGFASSKNIEISAAAANMQLTGKIGMVDKDYDLLMRVKPRSSAAAFTGGTLAGGPVLGAGLVLINKLLGLEKGSHDEYEITGSWEDPQVEQIVERSIEGASEE